MSWATVMRDLLVPWERLPPTLYRCARQGVLESQVGPHRPGRALFLNTNKGSSHPNKGPSGKRPVYFFRY